MQESLGKTLRELPGVDEVAPTVILMEPKNLVIVYGIDYQRFNGLSRGFLFRSGRPMMTPDEVMADDIVAQARHLKVGDQIVKVHCKECNKEHRYKSPHGAAKAVRNPSMTTPKPERAKPVERFEKPAVAADLLVELAQRARERRLAQDRDGQDIGLDVPRLIDDDAYLHDPLRTLAWPRARV